MTGRRSCGCSTGSASGTTPDRPAVAALPIVALVKSPLIGMLMEDIADGLRRHACTPVIYPSNEAFLGDPQAAAGTDVLLAASTLDVRRPLLERAPRLRAVLSCITGTDGFDESAATALGIVVGNAPIPENAESLAEATIMLMLACSYNLRRSESLLREQAPRPPRVHARMLKGRTIGLIGYGQITRAMIARLQGWGAALQVASARAGLELPADVRQVELGALMRTSDIVCVLTALTPATRGLIDAACLRLMKRGAIFINTARGGLVDETALAELAASGPLAMIALDVFATEPLPGDSPLRTLPNAILTPHMVGHTEDIAAALPMASVESVRRVIAGEPPVHVRNPEVLPAWTRRWGPAGAAMNTVASA